MTENPQKTESLNPGKIQKASLQDIIGLRHLLDQANQYSLRYNKILAWSKVEKAYKRIDQQVQLGNVFLRRNTNNVISSSITLCETNDEWGDAGQDNNALYFLKLMKDPEIAQPYEAVALIEFAAKKATQRNKQYLRCDIVADHSGLLAYYNRLGFTEKGRFVLHLVVVKGYYSKFPHLSW